MLWCVNVMEKDIDISTNRDNKASIIARRIDLVNISKYLYKLIREDGKEYYYAHEIALTDYYDNTVLKVINNPDLIVKFFNEQLTKDKYIESLDDENVTCHRYILDRNDKHNRTVFFKFDHAYCKYSYILFDREASEVVSAIDYIKELKLKNDLNNK